MILKYGIEIKDDIIKNSIGYLINQIYKLLPTREENKNWKKPLQTIMEELGGMSRLMEDHQEKFFPILSKMEGLFNLSKEEDFPLYRRTIFECLNLLSELEQNV